MLHTTNTPVHIGKATYRNQEYGIGLKQPDRFRHVYMIGKTGTGKSTLYQNMMLQDIRAGMGCCFVDPHGEAIDWLLGAIPPERREDVRIFDPSDSEWPLGLNLLEWHTETEKDFLVSEAIDIFYKLFDPDKTGVIGPQFEHWMRNAALTVMAMPSGGTLLDIPRLFTDPVFEKKARQQLTDKVVQSFWEQQMSKTSQFHRSEMLNYFTSKFGRFMTNGLMRNIVGQAQSSFSFEEAIQKKQIILINLSKGKIGELNAFMLGLILMAKLQVAVMKQAHVSPEDRQPFYLYVDEFQNVLTDTFIGMLSEARKYGLAVHLTNQYIAQLPEDIRQAVLGNVGTLLAFQVGSNDAAFLMREFETKTGRAATQLKEDDLQYLPKHHYYIRLLLDGMTYPAFLGTSLPPLSRENVLPADDVRWLSRLTVAQPRHIVEKSLKERWQE